MNCLRTGGLPAMDNPCGRMGRGGLRGGGDTGSCPYSTRFALLESVQFQLSPTFPGIFIPVQLSSYHVTQSLTAAGGWVKRCLFHFLSRAKSERCPLPEQNCLFILFFERNQFKLGLFLIHVIFTIFLIYWNAFNTLFESFVNSQTLNLSRGDVMKLMNFAEVALVKSLWFTLSVKSIKRLASWKVTSFFSCLTFPVSFTLSWVLISFKQLLLSLCSIVAFWSPAGLLLNTSVLSISTFLRRFSRKALIFLPSPSL